MRTEKSRDQQGFIFVGVFCVACFVIAAIPAGLTLLAYGAKIFLQLYILLYILPDVILSIVWRKLTHREAQARLHLSENIEGFINGVITLGLIMSTVVLITFSFNKTLYESIWVLALCICEFLLLAIRIYRKSKLDEKYNNFGYTASIVWLFGNIMLFGLLMFYTAG